MKKAFRDIDLRLCNTCGSCVGVCPNNAISIIDELPRLTGACNECGLCFEVCPGIEFPYPAMNRELFNDSNVDYEIGSYRAIHFARARNKQISEKASSGGVVTSLLSYLFDSGEIKAAVVVGQDKTRPWMPRANIALSKEEIFASAQSKYSMIPLNMLLADLTQYEGEVAYVGLPCHIHGLRKAQKAGHRGANKIKYCIGIFCGFNMSFKATEFLIKKSKIAKENIKSLEYRGGPWPGGFMIKSKDKKEYFLEKHSYNYLNSLFTPKRCLVCPDLTSEFADLSVGDAWHITGYSTVLTRSEKGERMMKMALACGIFDIKEGKSSDVKRGHGHLIAYKKHGLFLRMKLLNLHPQFQLCQTVKPKIKTNIFNFLFLLTFLISRSRIVFLLLKNIPPNLPGALAKIIRSKAQKSFSH
ncbi:MAG: hypothetical protein COV72_02150 [Candidatus Omnitrophica bacterium CG11_big_fil_rev_8_21_14_0_20_42_13]|uniref:4Fe-4S ferredoxin-type domain-containing protein n=1 Tax=Candidatus Ghiorseimicrobium undicola TaxID=1974746 RepID=A0A2H0LZ24_9BACT|nr:MAG: hypothetical protein COV72_02150 [Candidatus Omnitrophica bacterium CG11_big_fil_rev_8_21_14_0_20_42_13]